MTRDHWNSERTKLKPLHRRIEARVVDLCKSAGRTWRRLPYQDRERFLCEALKGMDPGDVYRWSTRYSLGDVLNATIMPARGKKAAED